MTNNLTIRDISKYAQVSTATVSRVLANSSKVKPETRDRVLKAIAEHGYEPNHVARNLTVKRTNTVGLVVESVANPFFVEVAQAVETELSQARLTLLLMSTSWDSNKELDSVRTLLRNRVDGILLTPISANSESVKLMQRWGLPFVLLNIDPTAEGLPTVSADNFRGGYLAAQALRESAAEQFFCLQGFAHESTFSRIDGFKAAMQQVPGESHREIRVIADVRTYQEGYDIVQSLMRKMPSSGPLGVFATNDDVALGVLASLFDHGIRVPQQVAVVGYDDIPAARRFQIPLTTIAQPIQEMGRIAAQELIHSLSDSDHQPKSHVLLPRLVQRSSTLPVSTPSDLYFRQKRP